MAILRVVRIVINYNHTSRIISIKSIIMATLLLVGDVMPRVMYKVAQLGWTNE